MAPRDASAPLPREGAPAEGDDPRSRRADSLSEARQAHRKLKTWVTREDQEEATSLGGVVAQTQQLLYTLAPGGAGH
ncbi:hypothetical protein V1460_15610 [Streptomyces sp. SCSIO 30461]|uniref:hypothetical protein n=1 Tax=Streptomyces sp. SCSIO 30461 TaxID=3118085 RepID=UPI0030D00717